MSEAFGPGVRMGVDVGTVRVGLALSDPDCILATPHDTFNRDTNPRKAFDVKIITKLCAQYGVRTVYVGLPRSLDGGENASTGMAREYAAAITKRLAAGDCAATVRLVDERLSTVAAHRSLLEAGVSRRRHMDKVDQQAAATFLQAALEQGRATGTEPGSPADQ